MAGGSAEAVGGSGGSTPLQGDPEPGNGGSAEATGAPGGPGKHGLPGQPGGRGYDGGAATARGGAGGWLVDTRQGRPVSWTWGGRGGDAAAFGGNGGCGGNGYPPDLGGAGGKATAIAGNGGLPAEHVYARDGDRGDPGDSDPPWPIEW